MSQESAEALALEVLAWLFASGDLGQVFLSASGLSADILRAKANDPEVLLAVLDFLTQDDAWVIAFCDARGHPYDAPLAARGALPGGEQVHWT